MSNLPQPTPTTQHNELGEQTNKAKFVDSVNSLCQPITILCALTPAQANAVHVQLHARFPELSLLRSARRLQMLNVSGRFRVSAIAGGQLPADLTPTVLAQIIATAVADHPADDGAYAQARIAYQVAHSRNGRRG